MSPSHPQQEVLVAPAQMTVGSLDDFRLEVTAAVTRADTASTSHVAVDLSGTQSIDATGLGVLLLLHKHAREKGLGVRLLGPSPSVREALRTMRVDRLFDIEATGDVAHPTVADPERSTFEATFEAAATPPPVDARCCSDCGRAWPVDREVQFCPWCGTGDPATPDPAGIPASVPADVIPAPPAIFLRRDSMAPHPDDFRALLDATELYHRIDEDGDARIIFPLESGRTQTAWITRNVDAIGEYAFRYVMSFIADAGEIAGNFALMGSLLEQVSSKKGGGLVTRGTMLLYRIPVSTQASPESLAGAVALAAGIADELETAITGEA